MRWRMPSNYRGGRAARSMPARWSLPKKFGRKFGPGRTMAKTDGTAPPSEKLASPERVAAFRTGLGGDPCRRLSDGQGLPDSRQTLQDPLWRDRSGGEEAQS